MARLHLTWITLLLAVLAVTLAACAAPATPLPPVKETVPVPQTVIVPQTVVVPQTVTVQQTVIVQSTAAPTATRPQATATVTPTISASIPAITPTVPVQLDVKTSAYLVLDLTNVICTPRKSCVASLPAAAALLKKARDAKVFVAYSDTASPNSTILPEVAQLPDDPKVTGRADKFFGTNLDDLLKAKGIKTVVIVGSAANGAVLYTAFGANIRGYTVVVAEDGISSDDAFAVLLTRYQLLNQPGFNNPTNTPLAAGRVTLSKSDQITFK